ncbi:MAG: hypothetical protein K6B69_08175 [Lachnospiraceae bacterium]|nr:hypothetical protein [Lachnospiraceae bacterium]
MEEEIVFERRTIWTVLKKMLLPGVIVLILLAVFFAGSAINARAHHVMQEARDVRVAMRLTELECRATGETLYDPTAPEGMTEGAGQRVHELSYADGEITLTGWDEDNGMPRSFAYRKGAFLVEYKAIEGGSATDGQWDIYYTLHILKYTTEWRE